MNKNKDQSPPLKVIEGDRKMLERKLLYEVALGETTAEIAGNQLKKRGRVKSVVAPGNEVNTRKDP
jgi:hypothetical protein